MLQRLRAPAIVCSSKEENENDFLNRHPQRNQKKATKSPPAKACSSASLLSKIGFSFFSDFDF